jgi:uncharacterized membrane protein YdjX (TVP38/TMEM64 family)
MKPLILSLTQHVIKEDVMFPRKLAIVLFSGLASMGIWAYREPLIASLQWFSDLDTITASIRGYGIWGPLALFVLFVLQTFFAFIPGQALMVASGYIYGFSGGILITWISLVLGGQMAFWLARHYGRPFVEKWVTSSTLNRWDKSAAGQGVGFYVVTLVMPFFPNDAMCYVAGLGKMPARRFLGANIIGRGIASLLTVIVGAFSKQFPALPWILLVGFVIVGILGWTLSRRYVSQAK